MSARRPQRTSIFAGLLLILLGAIFLLDRFHPQLGIAHLIRIYWPMLIIVWGVAKLIDSLATHEGQTRPPLLSGGEAALLVVLAFVLSGFVFRDWIRDHYPDLGIDLPPFHESYSRSQLLPPEMIPAGAHVEVDTVRGNITIHTGEGNQLRVGVNKSSWGSTESAADEQMKRVDVVVEQTGNGYRVHPAHQDDFHGRVGVDLDLQVPKTISVSADTNHGDVRISGVAGKIDARTGNGDIEIHQAGSDVSAELQGGDARITEVAGSLRVTGRGNDVEVSDVLGDATIEGPFIQSTHVRNVAKTTRCTSPWSDVTVEHLTGSLTLDAGDVQIADAGGAAKIVSHNKDIDVEDVAGRLEISDAHGDIKVGYSNPPHNQVSISNDSGEVELTLPAKSSFQVSAVSRSGEIESDFEDASLQLANEEGTGKLNGKFGVGGPNIAIATSYGTIQLHKST